MSDIRSSEEHGSIPLVRQFIERKLTPWPEFEAAMVVGSIAAGEARPDSDVDMVLVFDPLDERIAPAEFVWVPSDDSFHTVFEGPLGGVQIDAKRFSTNQLEFGDLSEGLKHELSHSLPLFDRTGRVGAILRNRLAYPQELRRARTLEYRNWAELLYGKAAPGGLERWRARVGPAGPADLLMGALDAIVALLHACNGEFVPFRYRRELSVSRLRWVPGAYSAFRDAVLIPNGSNADANFSQAYGALEEVLAQVDAHLREIGWARDFGHAWVQHHAELGRAYNMNEWRSAHESLLRERGTHLSPQ